MIVYCNGYLDDDGSVFLANRHKVELDTNNLIWYIFNEQHCYLHIHSDRLSFKDVQLKMARLLMWWINQKIFGKKKKNLKGGREREQPDCA